MSEIPRSHANVGDTFDDGQPDHAGDDGTVITVEVGEQTFRLLEIEQQMARKDLGIDEMRDLIDGLLDLRKSADTITMRIDVMIAELRERIAVLLFDVSREDRAEPVVTAASVASTGLRRVA